MALLNRGAFALPRRGVEQTPQVEPQGEILVLQTKMGLEFVHTLLQPQQRRSQARSVSIRARTSRTRSSAVLSPSVAGRFGAGRLMTMPPGSVRSQRNRVPRAPCS